MNILLLMGSPNQNGNTSFMADAFAEGAKEAGHNVTRLNIGSMKINGCLGCEFCHTKGEGKCCQNDDMQKVYPEIDKADMIVLASPVYYWTFSGQMSSLITRFYAKGMLKIPKYAMLLSSGSDGVYDAPISQYKSILDYFGAKDCGIITAFGEQNKTETKKTECFNLGRSL